jgi:DNA-binding CsgD family transcriptional regulator
MGLVNVWAVISSACYWAWFDSATFRPTLLLPFADAAGYYSLFFVITLTSGAVVLLISTLRKEQAIKILRLKPFGFIAVALAVFGNIAVLLGASFSNWIPIVIGAILTGSTCSFFLLEWARIYSRQGAKSACVLMSAAVALGAVIDTLITGLNPLFAALFTICLPILAVGFMFNTYGAMNAPAGAVIAIKDNAITELSTDQSPKQTAPISLNTIFPTRHKRFFGLSYSLVAAFFIFGFSFGYMQFNSAISTIDLYPFSSDTLLVSRGVTAFAIFLAAYFFPRHVYTIFRIGILVGIAGFIAIPFLSTMASSSLISGFIIAVGYTTFDVITWTLLAEIAFATGLSTVATFGPGRFVVHISVVAGFLVGLILLSNPQTSIFGQAASATVGYFLVIAEMLLLSGYSALWMLIRSKTAPDDETARSGTDSENAEKEKSGTGTHSLAQDIDAYGLTERETEILGFLLSGRSTPRIAQALCVSENTINSHIQHIYQKFGVHNRQDLLDRFS